MLNRIFKFSFFLLMFAAFTFTACEQEPIAEPNENFTDDNEIIEILENGEVMLTSLSEEDGQPSSIDTDRRRFRRFRHGNCYRLVFPLTVVLPDGINQIAENPRELRRIVRTWKRDNPDSDERPSILYPYNIELPKGDIFTIEDANDIKLVIFRCNLPNIVPFANTRCYSVIFPVTLVLPNGEEKEAMDSAEYRMIIKEYLQGERDTIGRIKIQKPFSVELVNGDVVKIESREDVKELVETCRDFIPRPGQRCFRAAFPVTVKFPGGRKTIVNDRRELFNVIDAWYDLNPRSKRHPRITFPRAVILEDGTRIVLNNRAEYLRLVQSCRADDSEDTE